MFGDVDDIGDNDVIIYWCNDYTSVFQKQICFPRVGELRV